jgi:hypothetical protein
MSPHGAPANSIHLCTEKNRSGCRLHRSLPSKNHAATPPQNHAVVEAPLRAVRAASSSFSGPMAPLRKRSERRHAFSCGCGISDKNEMARSFVYLCAPLSPPANQGYGCFVSRPPTPNFMQGYAGGVGKKSFTAQDLPRYWLRSV